MSLYLPGTGVRSSSHGNGLTTSYVTAPSAGGQSGGVDGVLT